MPPTVSAKAALTVTGLSTLPSDTYCVSDAIDTTVNHPDDVLIEVNITPGTVSSNKQAVVFFKTSLDGTNYQSGPESGTDDTDEVNLTRIGVIPLASSAVPESLTFSLYAALGFLPPYAKTVIKNDSGADFTAGTINVSEVLYS